MINAKACMIHTSLFCPCYKGCDMTYLLEMPKSPLLKHTTPKTVPKVTATRTNVPITDPTIIACWVALSRLFPGGENRNLISGNG